jgi:hypothetical protein
MSEKSPLNKPGRTEFGGSFSVKSRQTRTVYTRTRYCRRSPIRPAPSLVAKLGVCFLCSNRLPDRISHRPPSCLLPTDVRFFPRPPLPRSLKSLYAPIGAATCPVPSTRASTVAMSAAVGSRSTAYGPARTQFMNRTSLKRSSPT